MALLIVAEMFENGPNINLISQQDLFIHRVFVSLISVSARAVHINPNQTMRKDADMTVFPHGLEMYICMQGISAA
jgi:hypothetical protein